MSCRLSQVKINFKDTLSNQFLRFLILMINKKEAVQKNDSLVNSVDLTIRMKEDDFEQ
jgi:hypothetical protein